MWLFRPNIFSGQIADPTKNNTLEWNSCHGTDLPKNNFKRKSDLQTQTSPDLRKSERQ